LGVKFFNVLNHRFFILLLCLVFAELVFLFSIYRGDFAFLVYFIALAFMLYGVYRGDYEYFALIFVFFIPLDIVHSLWLFDSSLRLFSIWFIPLIVFLGVAFLVLHKIHRREPLFNDKFFIFLSLFYLAEIFSLAFVSRFAPFSSILAEQNLIVSIKQRIIFVFMIFLLISCFSNFNFLKKSLKVLFASSFITIVLSFYEIIMNRNLLSMKFLLKLNPVEYGERGLVGLAQSQLGHVRITSTFWDPNILGLFMVILILLSIPILISAEQRTVRRFMFFLVFIQFVVLIFTFSRSAFVCLIMGMLYLIFRYRQHFSKSFLIFTTGSFIGLLAYMLFNEAFVNFFSNLSSGLQHYSESDRYVLDRAAISMFMSNPIFGVGFGKFPIVVEKIAPFFVKHTGQAFSHNLYLNVLSEQGIVGFSLFIVLIAYLLKRIIFEYRPLPNQSLNAYYLSAGAVLLAMLAHSFVYVRFFNYYSLFFIALGLSIHKLTKSHSMLKA